MAINYMNVKDFREEGYLQEVNRRVLHPLGLAIEAQWSDDGSEMYCIISKDHLTALANCTAHLDNRSSAPRTGEEDDALDAAWKSIDDARPGVLGGIWDYRDDAEGNIFAFKDFPGNAELPPKTAEEQKEEFAAKANNVRDLWHARKRARVEALGYMVQPYDDTFFETGSDIINLLGDALGIEMNKVIPVKAESESWKKAVRGMLDKACEAFSGEFYDTQEVTPEEVHLIDILLGPEAMTGMNTRAEAINMLVDSRKAYKDVGEQAAQMLHRIATGDLPPGIEPQDFARQGLEHIAGQL